MTHTIITLKPDGSRSSQFGKPDLPTLQAATEGCVETLPYFSSFEGRRCIAYCNEEGYLKGMRYNKLASKAWSDGLPKTFKGRHRDVVGPVVITIKGVHP